MEVKAGVVKEETDCEEFGWNWGNPRTGRKGRKKRCRGCTTAVMLRGWWYPPTDQYYILLSMEEHGQQ